VNLSKKQKIGLGAAGVVGVGAIWYWRKKSAAAASSSSSSTDPNAIDPLTGLPYSQDQQTDPLTGLTYLGEAQQYGSVAAAEAAFSGGTSGSGYSAVGGGAYGGTAGYPTSNVGGTGSTGGYATNAQWAQAVTAGLTGLGYSATDVAAALGLFFAGQQLTTGADGVSYASIIQAAEAEFGPPPQGTYSIISAPSSGGPVGTSTGSGSSSSTSSSGGTSSTAPAPSSKPAGAISNLATSNVTSTGFHASWNAAQGATGGYKYVVSQLNGANVHEGVITGTSVTITNLHPGWTYNFGIQALPGGPGNNIHVALPSK
jgi:hypothetical protein